MSDPEFDIHDLEYLPEFPLTDELTSDERVLSIAEESDGQQAFPVHADPSHQIPILGLSHLSTGKFLG